VILKLPKRTYDRLMFAIGKAEDMARELDTGSFTPNGIKRFPEPRSKIATMGHGGSRQREGAPKLPETFRKLPMRATMAQGRPKEKSSIGDFFEQPKASEVSQARGPTSPQLRRSRRRKPAWRVNGVDQSGP